MATLKPKQITIIYEDLFTRTKPEGEARIIRYLGSCEPNVEMYLVHFIGDQPGQNVERRIFTGAQS